MTYSGNEGVPSSYRRTSSRKKKRKKQQIPAAKIIIAVLIVCAVAALIVFGVKLVKEKMDEKAIAEVETTAPEEALENDVRVDGVRITNLGRTQAKVAIEKKYDWAMKARFAGAQPDSYDIANLLDSSIEKTLDVIYSSSNPEDSYTITFEIDDDALDAEIENMKALWNKAAKNGSISGFNKETEEFEYSGSEKGVEIDEEKLRNDIRTAFSAKTFGKKIDVTARETEPEFNAEAAKAMYKTIGTYTTNSTNNADRNNNLDIACKAIDGKVLQVGEEFSFNFTTGMRTAELGYKEAAAYHNGEIVNEAGGGVCQVASTLYNAVIFSGIEVIERHPHTYAPTYVTPGEDATVSFDGEKGPDMRFVNTTSSTIVVRAHYEDRTVKCWIIGIPILAEGEKISMHSEKIGETEVPAPVYEDDPTMEAGVQIMAAKGDKGSTWNTYLKHEYPDGRVTDELFHVSRYKGHTPKIRRNQALWDPAFDVPPTDEAGNPLPVETKVNADGVIEYNYPTQPESTTGTDTVEIGPGVSSDKPKSPADAVMTEPEGSADGPGGSAQPEPEEPGDSGLSPVPGNIPLVPSVPGGPA